MGKLEGRVAIVTGGARGQGAAEAAVFVEQGATVFVTDVLVEEGEKTAAALGATFVEHDVADPAQWDALVTRVVADHGGRISVQSAHQCGTTVTVSLPRQSDLALECSATG